jgi:hypothetical protein
LGGVRTEEKELTEEITIIVRRLVTFLSSAGSSIPKAGNMMNKTHFIRNLLFTGEIDSQLIVVHISTLSNLENFVCVEYD